MLFSLLGLAVRHSIVARDASALTGETWYSSSAVSSANITESSNGSVGYCINGTPNGVLPSVRAVVGITCVLSMIGAVLIILSYILIKDTRTKPREILLNLSLMDFIVAAANLIGILINFDNFLRPDIPKPQHYSALNNICKVQASFAMYATISSILWTNCIAVYIFFHILYEGRFKTFWAMVSFYVLSYGLPLILMLWFVFTNKLGYSPYGSSGWCSVVVYDDMTGERHPLALVFANDIWFYLTITLVPVIFIALKCHLKYQLQSNQAVLTSTMANTVQKVEVKLIFIPIVFVLLRVWSFLLTVIAIEAGKKLKCPVVWFFIHMAGIGDSGQGFANAILFVLFTPKVRRYFLRLLFCHCFWSKASREHVNIQNTAKIYYGTASSNSGYRSDASVEPPTVSEGLVLDRGKI